MSHYSAPGYYVAPNRLATCALVLGILSLFLSPIIVGGVIALVALTLGIIAVRRPTGKGAAILGIIFAAFALAVAMLASLIWFAFHHAASPALATPSQLAARQMVTFNVALDQFELDADRYPTSAEGLAALITAPPALKGKWHGPYLKEIPDDPWGRPYLYVEPGAADPSSFQITSKGLDGILGTSDDIHKDTRP